MNGKKLKKNRKKKSKQNFILTYWNEDGAGGRNRTGTELGPTGF